MTNLTDLSIGYNPNIYPRHIIHPTRLVSLNIRNHHFTDEFIMAFINLTRLSLNNRITYEGIKNLSKLVDLDITASPILFSNQDVLRLTHLTHLFSHYEIGDEGIQNLTNLRALYFDYRHDNTISDKGLSKLTNLTILDLGSNTTVTQYGIQHLTKLIVLKGGYCLK